MSRQALGVDLGSSGLRLTLVDGRGEVTAHRQRPYPMAFEDPRGWLRGLVELIGELPPSSRRQVGAIALDGTSGTLLLCREDGRPLEGTLGQALPYHLACVDEAAAAAALVGTAQGRTALPAASPSGSLARALRLLHRARQKGIDGPLLLRHQADWLMGWLLGTWRWGEESNNLRLGWDQREGRWLGTIARQPWSESLPEIVEGGRPLGVLHREAAGALDLPTDCVVVTGSTDANAAVLAAEPEPGDGIAVLGTTLVLKQFVPAPIHGPGLSCHRLAGRWLVGGASNAGAGILRRFFSDARIEELSRQIDPERPSGLDLLPLPAPGERFPVDDPDLAPRLGPRPVSDALYLQALLEGLTAIEAAGWRRLGELGAPPLHRVISLGGGARNPHWRRLREQALGLPVLNRPQLSASLGMAQLARRALRRPPPSSTAPSDQDGRPTPLSPP